MRSRIATAMAWIICVFSIVIPLLAAAYLAHRQSMNEVSEQTTGMAAEVLRRGEVMVEESNAAYRKLSTVPGDNACSPASLMQMINIALDKRYLQAVGHVIGDRVECSSAGPPTIGFGFGPVNYETSSGVRVRTSVDLEVGSGKRFIVLERGGFVVAVSPATLLDVFVNQRNVSIGLYSRSGQTALASRGEFDPTWKKRLQQARDGVFFDGSHLVAIQASRESGIVAYAAVPRSYLMARLRAFAVVMLPIGLVLGILIMLAALYLARLRTSLPSALRTALRRREFVLHYQPIVEMASGRMVGAEALMRWPRGSEPGLSPALFIPTAEQYGLIGHFTEYALRQLANDAPRFIKQHPDAYLSVNLSPSDLHSGTVVDQLRHLIETPGIEARNIVAEVTEHSFLEPTKADHTIQRIRQLGIRVAIDDFGTGFSSLSHLTSLKTDYLKIDKVFVDAVGTESMLSQLALHLIGMAVSMKLIIVCEGVETRAQADFLQQHGVKYAQGWLFAKAQPMDELLRQRKSAVFTSTPT